MTQRPLSVLLALAALAAGSSATAQPASHLLVVDQDAGLVTDISAGALFNVDLDAATDSDPQVEASAEFGAPFELVSGLAISPLDGRAYIADLGIDDTAPFNPVGRIIAVDGATGDVEVIWAGAPLVQPFSVAFMPDGRLLIADPEADPAFLGTGPSCGNYGAIFVIDTATCTAPCMPTVLSDGTVHAFPPTVLTAFEEPLGIAYDPVRSRIYVADACASQRGHLGSLLWISPSTGRVSLSSTTAQFESPLSVDVRPDGTPLMVDQGTAVGDSTVWRIDVTNLNPEANATQFTGGTQYSAIQDVVVDGANRIFLVDWGEYDSGTNTYIAPPAIWRVDETNANPATNGVLVNESVEFLTPVAGAAVPVPVATSMTPSIISGPTNVIIEGANLHAGLLVDLGPNVAVSSVDLAPGYPVGAAIQAVVAPIGGAVIPVGCGGELNLTLEHPFGGQGVLPNAGQLDAGSGGISPAPPFSTRGDANRDGIVDGLDLAILGLHFGAEYCDGLAFANDADFNDDDLIDGADLARLTSYFGTRPR